MARTRARTVAVGGVVVLLHVLVVVLIDRGPREPKPPPDARAVTLALDEGPPGAGAPQAAAPEPAPAPATPPPSPPDPVAPPTAAPAPSPVASPPAPAMAVTQADDASQPNAAAGAATGVKEECDIPATLQSRLAQDAGVRAALARIPAGDRSVANAVMLWDGRWASSAGMGGDAAGNPIREVVTRSLELTPSPCMRAPVQGPRFILLPGTSRSTMLAFGSGVWRWADLLSPE